MSEELKFNAVTHDDAGMATADGILPETPVETAAAVSETRGEKETKPAEIEIPGFRVSTYGMESRELSVQADGILPETEPVVKTTEQTVTAATAVEEIIIPGFSVSTNTEECKVSPKEIVHIEEMTETTVLDEKNETVIIEEKTTETTVLDEMDERVVNEETGKLEPDHSDIKKEEPFSKGNGRQEEQNTKYTPNYDSTDDREIRGSFEGGIIPETPKEVIGVRFRSAGKIYYFSPGELTIRRGMHVIVETARGFEYGSVVGNPLVVTKKQFNKPLKTVTRIATDADALKQAENRAKEKEAYRIAREKIEKHGLEMKLVSAEYTFDGSKIMFYFTADGRIDFRDLVKDLAGVFRTRIELRQIGVRDETKMLGGYGPCGRPLCCSAYLSDFVPVSIKMAKEQSLSLNPTKISGVCGRLMCCLKNEEDTYEELNKNLPGVGDEVQGNDGLVGEVEGVNVLRQTIRVMVDVDDEKEIHEYGVGDFELVRKRRRGDRRHKAADPQNNDKTNGTSARGGRKPLSTVAAAVAAKQREEAELSRKVEAEAAGKTHTEAGLEAAQTRENAADKGNNTERRERGERRGRELTEEESRRSRGGRRSRDAAEGEGRRSRDAAEGEGRRSRDTAEGEGRRSRDAAENEGRRSHNVQNPEEKEKKVLEERRGNGAPHENRDSRKTQEEGTDRANNEGVRHHRSRRRGHGNGGVQNSAGNNGADRNSAPAKNANSTPSEND